MIVALVAYRIGLHLLYQPGLWLSATPAVSVRRRGDDQIEKSVRIFTKDFSAVSQSDFTFRLRHAGEFMRGIVKTRVCFLKIANSALLLDVVPSGRPWHRPD